MHSDRSTAVRADAKPARADRALMYNPGARKVTRPEIEAVVARIRATADLLDQADERAVVFDVADEICVIEMHLRMLYNVDHDGFPIRQSDN
ncbi:hypothetical protein [Phycicoccus sp. Root563]|uniref:hypothetical protein n=1 Tax=Phycicoccus sp. Root563 TaxID=1736562 RepID=UPI001F2CDA5C|nr:hypothetical protein [Phycicoccus sp. Root563]